jgi:2-polyprenyl-3-methyl-5-hydroxy-6-metoxy-1,4-benzoquinol methylase
MALSGMEVRACACIIRVDLPLRGSCIGIATFFTEQPEFPGSKKYNAARLDQGFIAMIVKANDDATARDFPEQWYNAASEDHFWMEWRARVLGEHLRRLGLDPNAPLFVFDIGCGRGAVQRRLNRSTAWIVDGCDLNDQAIARNTGHRGCTLNYNIFDKSPELQGRYDVVFLLDIIEHVEDPVAFMNAAAFYSKPTGVIVINVPSVPSLASAYDQAVGHLRRYTKTSLRRDMADAGLEIIRIAYWGMSLLPLLALRKVLTSFKTENLIARGFNPPGRLADKILRMAMTAELAVTHEMPWGTSLLAVGRTPANRPS